MSEFIRVEIYRQGVWQELPFNFLMNGDRYRPINGPTAGMIFKCMGDATEQFKHPGLWSVSAKMELC